MRVAVYAICLDELRFVERFLQSCEGADTVVVADTGSRDGTPEALRARGAVVHDIRVRPWRFDDARNAALALVPDDVTICIALDLDEVLSPGWRAALEAQWRPGHTRGRYLYVWSHKPDRTPAVAFWGERIHARRGYRWRHPCHEVLYPDRLVDRPVRLSGLQVDHWPDDGKSRANYLELLQVAVTEEPNNPRSAFYLGREHYLRKDWPQAEAALQRYLALPDATWTAQNAAAMRFIGKARLAQDDLAGAADWTRRATLEAPESRDAWVDLADVAYRGRDFETCLDAASRALSLGGVDDGGFGDARSNGSHPHVLAAHACWKLGRRDEALQRAVDAQAADPADARLGEMVAIFRKMLVAPDAEPSPPTAHDVTSKTDERIRLP